MNDDREPQENDPAADLAWRAFRYAAGEATADEARALEEQMAVDPAVCEAVIRAVKLGGELAAARPDDADIATVSPLSLGELPGRQPGRAITWWPIAAAACIAFVVGAFVSRSGNVPPGPIAQVPPDAAPTANAAAIDADAWLQLRDLDDETNLTQLAGEWEPDELPGIDVGRGAAVPAWLVDLATTTKPKGNP